MSVSAEFRALSARLGRDPLQVQGPGGNTSIKDGDVMWIKASGTELAEAQERDIFVAVDRALARGEAMGAGDGTCRAAVIEDGRGLRPSIETTFHALIDWPVVVHTHSVATLVHAISPQGLRALPGKLAGFAHVVVPYAKPGVDLTAAIAARMTPETRVFVLANHGLICCGETVEEVAELIERVEATLAMPERAFETRPGAGAPDGFAFVPEIAPLAQDARLMKLAAAGSYYPDHIVFLGPALPMAQGDPDRPAQIVAGEGVALRVGATASQAAMAQCLFDVLARLPEDWDASALTGDEEAAIMDWDAEKYRQALAARRT